MSVVEECCVLLGLCETFIPTLRGRGREDKCESAQPSRHQENHKQVEHQDNLTGKRYNSKEQREWIALALSIHE